ncbi:hypothetical protein EA772_01390 [Pedobacter sp. G11]|uniref:RHS repeat protein n=1 Tax=Pedobacter sp. G11 TaxID=2482728 RepID=UPI000F5DABA7|nr:RHS repeat protein [Pedobacter sp. G11]AZI24060.1 hypothetical protein EA772_01390 [Pedobacter sp. G11]
MKNAVKVNNLSFMQANDSQSKLNNKHSFMRSLIKEYLAGLLIFVLSFTISIEVYGQANQPGITTDMVSILSPSPNAASLGKYLEIPVGEYTGIPNIEIPIYQLNQGDISMNLSLSYHAGGIKVDDIASWAGTGWSLNAGGTVIRITRGIPDSYNSQISANRYANDQMTALERQTYINAVYRGTADSEPDLYIARAGDLSISFFEDLSGNFHVLDNNPNIKIQRDLNGIDWIITNGKGIKYKFGAREYTEADTRFRRSDAAEIDGGFFFDVSNWYLTEVEDTKSNKLTFEYVNTIISFLTRGVERMKVPIQANVVDCQPYGEYNYTYNTISGKRISAINFKNGRINIYGGLPRQDCNGDVSIDRIEVINHNGELVKNMKFFTSYFDNNAVGTSGLNYYTAMDQKRLRLDSVREERGNLFDKPYKFTYYISQGLPYRNSNAQDHYGYFNGQNNNTSVSYYSQSSASQQGANKNIDAAFTKECVLTAITYPTGGTMNLELEGNNYVSRRINGPGGGGTEEVIIPLTGNNNNSSTDFHFEKSFTITQADLEGGSYKNAWFRLYTEGLQSGTSATLQFRMLWPDGIYRALQIGIFNVYQLVEGNYKIEADITTEYAGNPYVYFNSSLYYFKQAASTPGDTTLVQLAGPGLRVKRIIHKSFDGPDMVEEYDYNNPNNSSSSGLVGNLPEYVSTQTTVNQRIAQGPNGTLTEYFNCDYKVYSSASNRSLINSKGSFIGYSFVTKTRTGSGNQGRILSKYSNFSEFNDLNYAAAFPFPPNSSQDWKRGLLLKRKFFDATGQERRTESYQYQVLSNSTVNNFGYKVGAHTLMNYSGVNESAIYNSLSVLRYDVSTDAYKLLADTIVEVNNNLSMLADRKYKYSPSGFMLSEIENGSSDGGSYIQRLYYPKDYLANAGSSPSLGSLLEYNILDNPIEEVNLKKINGVEKLISGVVNEYGYDQINQRKIFSLRKVFTSGNDLTTSNNTYNFIQIPSRYEEKWNYGFHDAEGKPRLVTERQLHKTSYLYSYNSQYPIAEIKNVSYATIESVLGGPANVSSFAASNPKDAEVNNLVTNLRSSPLLKEAQIISYTYKPLVGMTSMTDAKGMTTYYHYDAFGRLQFVKDQDGNVVKQNTYHYKN